MYIILYMGYLVLYTGKLNCYVQRDESCDDDDDAAAAVTERKVMETKIYIFVDCTAW